MSAMACLQRLFCDLYSPHGWRAAREDSRVAWRPLLSHLLGCEAHSRNCRWSLRRLKRREVHRIWHLSGRCGIADHCSRKRFKMVAGRCCRKPYNSCRFLHPFLWAEAMSSDRLALNRDFTQNPSMSTTACSRQLSCALSFEWYSHPGNATKTHKDGASPGGPKMPLADKLLGFCGAPPSGHCCRIATSLFEWLWVSAGWSHPTSRTAGFAIEANWRRDEAVKETAEEGWSVGQHGPLRAAD